MRLALHHLIDPNDEMLDHSSQNKKDHPKLSLQMILQFIFGEHNNWLALKISYILFILFPHLDIEDHRLFTSSVMLANS